MSDFVIVSSDLRLHVLDARVKRGAEQSTDHRLVVSRVRLRGMSVPWTDLVMMYFYFKISLQVKVRAATVKLLGIHWLVRLLKC